MYDYTGVESALDWADPTVHNLLEALGHRPSARVSVNFRPPNLPFRSELLQVRELRGWRPPSDADCYLGVNPISASVRRGRGTDDDVTRVVALFADLDIKADCLETMDECREVAARLSRLLGTSPVALVETGHGLQPYWRIASPPQSSNVIRADDDNDTRLTREEWRRLYLRFGGLVKQIVREVRPDASIDNVYNLSRILRAPDSVNRKHTPVDVTMTLSTGSVPVTWREINAVLDRVNAVPLSGTVRGRTPSMPTSLGQAIDWINRQPGAQLDVEELLPLGRYRALVDFLDYDGLVRTFQYGTGEDPSAHSQMTKKVLHAVYRSTEGAAGLVLALKIVNAAYRDVMRMRREEQADGEPRSDEVALNDFYRAVRGAVAKARARPEAVAYQRDREGRLIVRTRVASAAETESSNS